MCHIEWRTFTNVFIDVNNVGDTHTTEFPLISVDRDCNEIEYEIGNWLKLSENVIFTFVGPRYVIHFFNSFTSLK